MDAGSDRDVQDDFGVLLSYTFLSSTALSVNSSIAPMLCSESRYSNASVFLCGLGVFDSFGTATSAHSNSDKRLE